MVKISYEKNQTRLSEKLGILLNEIESRNTPLTIGHATEVIGDKSFGILLLFLAMPSSLPVAGTAFATLFGLVIILLLVQMLCGKTIPWLPEKVRSTKISVEFSIKMLTFSIKILKKIEGLIHPRLTGISKSKILYIILLILTLILVLPFPFTNTPPALVILLCSIGLIEGDGLICLITALIGVILIACYIFAFYFIFTYGLDAVMALISNFGHK